MHTRFSRVPYDLSSEFTKYLTYMHDVLTSFEKGDNEYNDINANLTELRQKKPKSIKPVPYQFVYTAIMDSHNNL